MIPLTNPDTGYLPPGIHPADWDELVNRFGGNMRRAWLLEGLLAACRNLAGAGCKEVLLGGSFVTEKVMPGDYDGVWETQGVDPNRLDPVILDSTGRFAAVRTRYRGDLFPASLEAEPGMNFRDFFQTDRDDNPKGVVLLNLGSLP